MTKTIKTTANAAAKTAAKTARQKARRAEQRAAVAAGAAQLEAAFALDAGPGAAVRAKGEAKVDKALAADLARKEKKAKRERAATMPDANETVVGFEQRTVDLGVELTPVASRSIRRRKAVQAGAPVPAIVTGPDGGDIVIDGQTGTTNVRTAAGFNVGDKVRAGKAAGLIQSFDLVEGVITAVIVRPNGNLTVRASVGDLVLLASAPGGEVEADPLTPAPADVVIGEAPLDKLIVTAEQATALDEAYSADVLPEGRIRKPVRIGERLYIGTGGNRINEVLQEDVFVSAYPGITPRTYGQTTAAGIKGDAFYFGMRAKTGRVPVVLGPDVDFVLEGAKKAAAGPRTGRKAAKPAGEPGTAAARAPKAAKVIAVGTRVRYRAGGVAREGVVTALLAGDRAAITLDGGKLSERFTRELTVVAA